MGNRILVKTYLFTIGKSLFLVNALVQKFLSGLRVKMIPLMLSSNYYFVNRIISLCLRQGSWSEDVVALS